MSPRDVSTSEEEQCLEGCGLALVHGIALELAWRGAFLAAVGLRGSVLGTAYPPCTVFCLGS